MKKYLDLVLDSLKKPLVTAILGLVIGLLIGLPVLGWWLLPVKWKDAGIKDIRKDLQQEYLKMVIESYAYDQNPELALLRWQEMGDLGGQVLSEIQTDPTLKPEDIANFSLLAQQPYTSPSGVQPTQSSVQTQVPGGVTQPTTQPTATKSALSPVLLLGILCLFMLLVGGALLYVLVLRKRPSGGSLLKPVRQQTGAVDSEKQMMAQEGPETPIAQFMSTYQLGDDLYDDSFSIDSPSGEFLGECGVGISETIGVGDPKKVTAFEVWLFDKNDIQTITKVLMSEHAFNDSAINQRLVSKGEPILVDVGKQILLETATLQLEARVVDMRYGQGALPDASFFERVTLELSVMPKTANQ
jgi:hypothetical protein